MNHLHTALDRIHYLPSSMDRIFLLVLANPVHGFFLICLLAMIAVLLWTLVSNLMAAVFDLLNAILRHFNIWWHGWPPPHLDANGSHKAPAPKEDNDQPAD